MKKYQFKIIVRVISLVTFFSCEPERDITVEYLLENYNLYQLEELMNFKQDTLKTKEFIHDKKTREIIKQVELETLMLAIKTLYGPDNRIEFYQEKDENKIKNSRGVVALVREDKLSYINGKVKLNTACRFDDNNNLCSGENFELQPVVGFCSGFAIEKNIIVTAGHCVYNDQDLSSIRFVFDFKATGENIINTEIDDSLVYSGKRVIAREYRGDYDFAIIEIEGEIPENRRTLILNKENKIRDNENVYVIGHPAGLPLKIADNSYVRYNDNDFYFTANLDTYGGNSGSPVINSKTHEVEGILVRGEPDFILGDSGRCNISNVCPNTGCRGEDVSRVSQFKQHIDNFLIFN